MKKEQNQPLNHKTDKITVDWLYEQYMQPCSRYSRESLEKLFGGGKTILQLLKMPIPPGDKMFVLDFTDSTGFLRKYPGLRMLLRKRLRDGDYLWQNTWRGEELLSLIAYHVSHHPAEQPTKVETC